MNTEVIPANAGTVTETVTPMSMISIAVERGADVDQLTKLMELQERYESGQARKAFNEAMTAFKANPPDIHKNKDVSYNAVSYSHATLDHVANAISASMSEHGLSFRWDVHQNGQIEVTCVLMHSLGHSEKVTLSAEADKSGSKNSIQAIGSTVTYLQRYTLLAATGLAARGMDDDGHSATPVETITDEQLSDLLAKMDEYEKKDWFGQKVLSAFNIESLSDLPAIEYDNVIQKLEKFIADS